MSQLLEITRRKSLKKKASNFENLSDICRVILVLKSQKERIILQQNYRSGNDLIRDHILWWSDWNFFAFSKKFKLKESLL